MARWQLQEAKARLSELIREATSNGPQEITVHGEPTAVLMSMSQYHALTQKKPRFVEFMRSSPLVGVELELVRAKSASRDIEL